MAAAVVPVASGGSKRKTVQLAAGEPSAKRKSPPPPQVPSSEPAAAAAGPEARNGDQGAKAPLRGPTLAQLKKLWDHCNCLSNAISDGDGFVRHCQRIVAEDDSADGPRLHELEALWEAKESVMEAITAVCKMDKVVSLAVNNGYAPEEHDEWDGGDAVFEAVREARDALKKGGTLQYYSGTDVDKSDGDDDGDADDKSDADDPDAQPTSASSAGAAAAAATAPTKHKRAVGAAAAAAAVASPERE